MAEFTQAMGDPKFWRSLGTAFKEAPGKLVNELQAFGQIPGQADQIAEERFPNSARDSSTKNAFRHALGTGMVTQRLGGGPIAAAAAKMAGYGWEALGARELLRSEDHRIDTLHDLNANAIGADVATQTANQQEMIERLDQLARESKPTLPRNMFRASNGAFTRSVR